MDMNILIIINCIKLCVKKPKVVWLLARLAD
jgi:hypothetical protein